MVQIKCPSCGETVEVSRMCRYCGASIPADEYEKAKNAGEALTELPETLVQVRANNNIGIAGIDDAESLYKKSKNILQRLDGYQSLNQSDFDALQSETTALYETIQIEKQREARRKQDEINKAREAPIRKAQGELNAIKAKRVVFSLIYYGIFIAIAIGVFLLKENVSNETLDTWLVGGFGVIGLLIGFSLGIWGAIGGGIIGALFGKLVKLLLTSLVGNVIFVFILFIPAFFLHKGILSDHFYISSELQKRANGELEETGNS